MRSHFLKAGKNVQPECAPDTPRPLSPSLSVVGSLLGKQALYGDVNALGTGVADSVDRAFLRFPSHALPSQKLSLVLLPHPSCTRRPFRHSVFRNLNDGLAKEIGQTLALAAALLVT